MWRLRWASRFKKQYKNLDPNMQQNVDEAIMEIASSVNPAILGTYKSNMRVFAYELGRKYRVICPIQYRDGIVDLLRVCDHKSTYGKE